MGIQIDAAGNVTTSNTITSSTTITGNPIAGGSGGISSSGPIGSSAGLSGTTGTFSSGMSATTGTFSGGISATTGSFSSTIFAPAASITGGVSSSSISTGTIGCTGNLSGNGFYGAYFNSSGSVDTATGTSTNAATGAFAITALNYGVSGPYRYCNLVNGSGHGDVSYQVSYHQPGVESFVQWSIGGSGNYFRMSNNGQGTSQASWTTTSDRRAKDDIQPIENALAKIKTLVGFTFLKPAMISYEGVVPRKMGLIAQDVLKVAREAVDIPRNYDEVTDTGDNLAVDYNGLVGLLVAGINELAEQIAELKSKNL